eukprot:6488372-Amphidinium_carterae.2
MSTGRLVFNSLLLSPPNYATKLSNPIISRHMGGAFFHRATQVQMCQAYGKAVACTRLPGQSVHP